MEIVKLSGDSENIEVLNSLPDNYDWALKAINAHKVWDKTEGEDVKVMIIDAGVNINHKDLESSFVKGMNFINNRSGVKDYFNHGTHVAGLIVGKYTGVAPKAELYVAKSLDDFGRGNMRTIMDGITYAINLNVDVISMSLGSKLNLPVQVKERISKATDRGIIIVSAFGNDGKPSPNFPAGQDNIIGVSGLDENLKYAKFSNRGIGVDISAPSTNILSTYGDDTYSYMTGTSMASGLVVGGIALMKSYYRKQGVELSLLDVKNKIKQLGQHSHSYGYGVLDLEKLIL